MVRVEVRVERRDPLGIKARLVKRGLARRGAEVVEQGADIHLVQLLLDHEDLSTTALYTKVTDERTAGAVMGLRTFATVPPQAQSHERIGVIGSASAPGLSQSE